MLKQIVLGWKLFERTLQGKLRSLFTAGKLTVVGLTVMSASIGYSLLTPVTAVADASPSANTTVNFQGRLQRNSGSVVDASTYNIEFKLYNSANGGKALWTEDYLNSAGNGVSVDTTGYFSAKLGSITAFPADMNWNQQLWLTMNIGGVSTTVSWDGEMNPRLQLTATPYAFAAGKLATQSGSNISTLDWANQTASNTILLPNKSGTLCVSGDSEGCGFAAGNANSYIQNATSPQTNTNFNISGNGTIGGSLSFNGQTSAILGSPSGLNINAQTGDVTLSSMTGSVVAKSTNDSSTGPAFAVQNANAVNLLAAYTGVSLVKVGMGMPTLASTGLGDLFVSGSGEFGVSLRVGNGQNGLNFSAGYAPSNSNGFYLGNSRPVKTISQIPTFNGMTTTGNPKGNLTTSIDTSNGTLRNYYNWTTIQSSAQTESMFIQIPVPRDFSALTDKDQICFNVYTDDDSGDSKVKATFYDTTNKAQDEADVTPDKANQWQRKCTTNIGGTITVDGNTYVTVQISITAAPNKNVRVSNFSFDYLSAF